MVTLKQRLDALSCKRPADDAVRSMLFGLLGQLAQRSGTRALAERWITAAEDAARIEKGTILTTGIAPWDRAQAASARLDAVRQSSGRRVPHGAWTPWPTIERDCWTAEAAIKRFRRAQPSASRPKRIAEYNRILREDLHHSRPLGHQEEVNIENAKRLTTAARILAGYAHHLKPGALKKGLDRLKRQ